MYYIMLQYITIGGNMGYFDYINSLPEPLGKEVQNDLLKKFYETGDLEARELLIEHNIRLCVYCVNQSIGKGYDYDDFLQIATIELMNVIDNKYDITMGTEFSSFAVLCIKRTLSNYLKTVNKDKRRFEYREDLFENIESYLASKSLNKIASELIEEVGNEEVVEQFLQSLSERDRFIFERSYGFVDDKPMSIQKLAKILNISASRVGERLMVLKEMFKKFYITNGQTPEALQNEALVEYYNQTDNDVHKEILRYSLGVDGSEKNNLTEVAKILGLRKAYVYKQMGDIIKTCGNTFKQEVTDDDLYKYYCTAIYKTERDVLELYLGLNGKEKTTDIYEISDILGLKYTVAYTAFRAINSKVRKALAKENMSLQKELISLEEISDYYVSGATPKEKVIMERLYGLNGIERGTMQEVADEFNIPIERLHDKKRKIEKKIKDNIFAQEQM